MYKERGRGSWEVGEGTVEGETLPGGEREQGNFNSVSKMVAYF